MPAHGFIQTSQTHPPLGTRHPQPLGTTNTASMALLVSLFLSAQPVCLWWCEEASCLGLCAHVTNRLCPSHLSPPLWSAWPSPRAQGGSPSSTNWVKRRRSKQGGVLCPRWEPGHPRSWDPRAKCFISCVFCLCRPVIK